MQTTTFDKDTMIFGEGERGDFAYVIKSGRVHIVKNGPNGATLIGEVRAGGLFGEMALIDSAPRMASAIAVEPTVCIVVPSGAFESKVAAADPLTQKVIGVLMRNLRALAERIDDARSGHYQSLPLGDVPQALPELPRAALRQSFESQDSPKRSACLALDALNAMLLAVGESRLREDTLFDMVRRAVSNRRLPRVVAEVAETLRGLGLDQSLASPVWEDPFKAEEEALHLREFVMSVAQLLFGAPSNLAALRDARRKKILEARAVNRAAGAAVFVPRRSKGFYSNRFSTREVRKAR